MIKPMRMVALFVSCFFCADILLSVQSPFSFDVNPSFVNAKTPLHMASACFNPDVWAEIEEDEAGCEKRIPQPYLPHVFDHNNFACMGVVLGLLPWVHGDVVFAEHVSKRGARDPPV